TPLRSVALASQTQPPIPSSHFLTRPPTPPIYPPSLHAALPICPRRAGPAPSPGPGPPRPPPATAGPARPGPARRATGPRWSGRRSEEHTSELQSRGQLVCRLLLEKKKQELSSCWRRGGSSSAV